MPSLCWCQVESIRIWQYQSWARCWLVLVFSLQLGGGENGGGGQYAPRSASSLHCVLSVSLLQAAEVSVLDEVYHLQELSAHCSSLADSYETLPAHSEQAVSNLQLDLGRLFKQVRGWKLLLVNVSILLGFRCMHWMDYMIEWKPSMLFYVCDNALFENISVLSWALCRNFERDIWR